MKAPVADQPAPSLTPKLPITPAGGSPDGVGAVRGECAAHAPGGVAGVDRSRERRRVGETGDVTRRRSPCRRSSTRSSRPSGWRSPSPYASSPEAAYWAPALFTVPIAPPSYSALPVVGRSAGSGMLPATQVPRCVEARTSWGSAPPVFPLTSVPHQPHFMKLQSVQLASVGTFGCETALADATYVDGFVPEVCDTAVPAKPSPTRPRSCSQRRRSGRRQRRRRHLRRRMRRQPAERRPVVGPKPCR